MGNKWENSTIGTNKEKKNMISKFNKELEDVKKMEDILKQDNKLFNEKFELISFMGSGSAGNCYKGRSKKSKKEVAVKVIFNEEGWKLKTNEIHFLRKLKHKNIININGCFPINNSACIIMELGKYHDLRYFQKKILRRKWLSETLLCYIAKQILEGLNYCHNAKIVHSDIKPQNIIIDESPTVKIIDFSTSYSYKDYPNDKITLKTCGTNFYMSPEVMGSQEIEVKELNKVDIFSLGVLLYNLAFDKYPYGLTHDDGDYFWLIYNKIKENELEIPNESDLSDSFKDFLRKILDKDIKTRISISEALNHYWVKGAEIIFEEKDKINHIGAFSTELMADNIKKYNDYIFPIKSNCN